MHNNMSIFISGLLLLTLILIVGYLYFKYKITKASVNKPVYTNNEEQISKNVTKIISPYTEEDLEKVINKLDKLSEKLKSSKGFL